MQEDDFGFSFMDDKSLLNEHQRKIRELRDMIMPFLNKLKANPESDTIKWPGKNRVKSIDNFIEKMNKLVDE